VVSAERVPERAPKDLLLPMSMHIEDKGLDAAEPGVLLACFQEARHFTPGTRARFGRLAARAALTGALGAGMAVTPAPGVRGASLGPGDPLRGEWSVIMVGPHFAAALVARDRGDDGPDPDRRFDFVITHDRDLVIRAAQPLLDRLVPAT
jgi:DICT domain-containing protein